MGPHGARAHGAGPGPGPLGTGDRYQEKHVLGKSNMSHAEKWCLIGSFEGIRDQGVHEQDSDVHIPRQGLLDTTSSYSRWVCVYGFVWICIENMYLY